MMELLRDLDHDQGGTMMVPLRNFDPATAGIMIEYRNYTFHV
jgi:hypothetical protein